MPAHLGDASKEGNDTHGRHRRRHDRSRARLSSLQPHTVLSTRRTGATVHIAYTTATAATFTTVVEVSWPPATRIDESPPSSGIPRHSSTTRTVEDPPQHSYHLLTALLQTKSSAQIGPGWAQIGPALPAADPPALVPPRARRLQEPSAESVTAAPPASPPRPWRPIAVARDARRRRPQEAPGLLPPRRTPASPQLLPASTSSPSRRVAASTPSAAQLPSHPARGRPTGCARSCPPPLRPGAATTADVGGGSGKGSSGQGGRWL